MVRLARGRFVFGAFASLLALACSGSDGAPGSNGAMGTTGATGVVGANGDRGAMGSTGAVALTRSSEELPGAQCRSGGRAIHFGVDANGNGALDDDEVSGTFYVCNGSPGGAQLSAVPVGDSRCPNGGIAVLLDGKAEGVACNGTTGIAGETGANGEDGDVGDVGATGAKGATGATGDTGATGTKGADGDTGPTGPSGAAGAKGSDGAKGPTGDPGPMGAKGEVGDPGATGTKGATGDAGAPGAKGPRGDANTPAPEVVFGLFASAQVVKGVLVTCASTTSTATKATCDGLQVNGMYARLAGGEANAICAGITGKAYDMASGSGALPAPYLVWINGWVLQLTGTTAPMGSLTCNR